MLLAIPLMLAITAFRCSMPTFRHYSATPLLLNPIRHDAVFVQIFHPPCRAIICHVRFNAIFFTIRRHIFRRCCHTSWYDGYVAALLALLLLAFWRYFAAAIGVFAIFAAAMLSLVRHGYYATPPGCCRVALRFAAVTLPFLHSFAAMFSLNDGGFSLIFSAFATVLPPAAASAAEYAAFRVSYATPCHTLRQFLCRQLPLPLLLPLPATPGWALLPPDRGYVANIVCHWCHYYYFWLNCRCSVCHAACRWCHFDASRYCFSLPLLAPSAAAIAQVVGDTSAEAADAAIRCCRCHIRHFHMFRQ